MTIPQVAFIFGREQPRTDVDKTWSDSLAGVKTTTKLDRQYYTRAKTATLTESFPTPTTESRAHDESFSDSLAAVKTTGEVDQIYPKDLVGTLDEASCNGGVTCDLTWVLDGYTSETMTIERYDGSWANVDNNVTAGLTAYADTNSTETTSKYRIKLNVAGSEWEEDNVNLLCPA